MGVGLFEVVDDERGCGMGDRWGFLEGFYS